jgi:predicted acylesterase/phospholipase RssA
MSLSLTLTLSGGASLGAYEAGATAAVLEATNALREHGEDVAVDAFGGASAGALVAMFAAHAQTNRIDPVWLLKEAWVERVSLGLLKGRGLRSPLGFETLRDRIDELLDPRDDAGRPAHRRSGSADDHAVGLHVALTGLRGLHYQVDGLGELNPVQAATYADWGGFTLGPEGGTSAIREPAGRSILDFVLASASNPSAFAPRALDRSDDIDGYQHNGIQDFPSSGHLWYTDGGTLQVEPIGRVLTAARKARESAGRSDPERHLTLLVDPRSETPSRSDAWAREDSRPSWVAGIARTLAIIPAQILYDDLRRVEKMNSRQIWAERLVATLSPHLDDGAGGDLAELAEQITAEQNEMRASPPDDARPGPPSEASTTELVQYVLAQLASLDRKYKTEVDVISPLLLAEEDEAHVSGLLAGEILGDFGGFLDRSLRESDFLLGCDCTLRWLPDNLRRLGLSDEAADHAVRAVESRVPDRWHHRNRGKAALEDLPWRARVGLARLILRMTAVLSKDLWSTLRPW